LVGLDLARDGDGNGLAEVSSVSVCRVFVLVPDPVGSGFVDSLARPGGNATGFMLYEYSTYGKYVELLKEVAPGVTHMAVLRDAAITSGIGQFGVIQAMAAALKLEVIPVNVRDAAEIEQAVTSFAHSANGGLLVTGSPLTFLHRSQIIALAARHKSSLPVPSTRHTLPRQLTLNTCLTDAMGPMAGTAIHPPEGGPRLAAGQ
jgi:hypothetical protein